MNKIVLIFSDPKIVITFFNADEHVLIHLAFIFPVP